MRKWWLALLAMLLAMPGMAADISLSGFGTIGYARSNRPYAYQRFIDDSGDFRRDTVLGAQMDLQFNNEFGATVQVKAAAPQYSDNQWDLSTSWAFLSWRPRNDVLVRVGKIRTNFLLNSQNVDVGTTFTQARLPAELYSMAPTSDYLGVSVDKTWNLASGELGVNAWWGKANTDWRFFYRSNITAPPPLPTIERGAIFNEIVAEPMGVALSWRHDEDEYRVMLNRSTLRPPNGEYLQRWGYASIPGTPYGYYTPFSGDGAVSVSKMHSQELILSARIALPKGVVLTTEVGRRTMSGLDFGPEAHGGYLSLEKTIGRWTPYATWATLRSASGPMNYYRAVSSNTVPSSVFLAPLINAYQQALADNMWAYDQRSLALGFSYALSPTSKFKAEWQRVHIGETSSLVDGPAGSHVDNASINVLSASYNFVF